MLDLDAARRDGAASDLPVAELLRDSERGDVPVDGTRACDLRAQPPEGELEHRSAHLRAHAAPLEAPAQPRPRAHGARLREVLALHRLDAGRLSLDEDAELEVPLVGAPLAAAHLVVGVEPAELGIVRPRDRERHELGRVDAGQRHPAQRPELLGRRQAQLEPRRLQPQPEERRDVHQPSFSGCPSWPSSAMSRRKKSETVQSTTTRSFRCASGSWYRWYERVTHQPSKPRIRRPRTSAIPLCLPSVATWPSIR